jgi:hypothetical protein
LLDSLNFMPFYFFFLLGVVLFANFKLIIFSIK